MFQNGRVACFPCTFVAVVHLHGQVGRDMPSVEIPEGEGSIEIRYRRSDQGIPTRRPSPCMITTLSNTENVVGVLALLQLYNQKPRLYGSPPLRIVRTVSFMSCHRLLGRNICIVSLLYRGRVAPLISQVMGCVSGSLSVTTLESAEGNTPFDEHKYRVRELSRST